MLAMTSRFTTSIAGAIVLVVIASAFFIVFDLNIALGSSEGLPVVEIGRGALPDPSPAASPDASSVAGAEQQPQGTEGPVYGTSTARAQQQSVQNQSPSQSSDPAAGVEANGTSAQTDDTTREYVAEEVQVNGRRPDPQTEHPGLGNGLLKNPKD